jgi:hypothetical protein
MQCRPYTDLTQSDPAFAKAGHCSHALGADGERLLKVLSEERRLKLSAVSEQPCHEDN